MTRKLLAFGFLLATGLAAIYYIWSFGQEEYFVSILSLVVGIITLLLGIKAWPSESVTNVDDDSLVTEYRSQADALAVRLHRVVVSNQPAGEATEISSYQSEWTEPGIVLWAHAGGLNIDTLLSAYRALKKADESLYEYPSSKLRRRPALLKDVSTNLTKAEEALKALEAAAPATK